MPVSSEQADGPKKVKEVFDSPLKKPEFVNEPHKRVFPILKLQYPNATWLVSVQEAHCGNIITGGVTTVSSVSFGIVSVRIVSTGMVSCGAPSKLYSFTQPVF